MKSGTLAITPRYVTLLTGTKEWIYDDEDHFYTDETRLILDVDSSEGLADGHTLQILSRPTIRNVVWEGGVGSIVNEQHIQIVSPDDPNVEMNYIISESFGRLTVTPRYVTLTTADKAWIYDDEEHYDLAGTTLTATVGHDADGGLVAGQSWNITNAPTIREVGSILNEQKIEIISAKGYGNVIANYVIEKDFGTLTITPRYITLTTGSGEWIYDDTVHENRYNTTIASTTGHVEDGGLVTGQTWNITNAPTIREVVWVDGIVGGEVGSISNEQEIEIISANGHGNVIANYVIEKDFGTLKVTPRYITLTTGSGEWIYDDTVHENRYHTTIASTTGHVADGGLVTGQTWNIINAPTIREVVWVDGIVGGEVGSISNEQEIEIISANGYGDVIDNYIVEEIFGTLKVTPRYITLTTGSGEWIYDDENHSNTVDTTVTATAGHDTDGGFAPGQDWYVIYTPSIRNVVWKDWIVGGEVESISNQVAINIDSVYGYGSVIDNYVVEEIFGTLKILPRYITLTTGSGEWIYDDENHSNTADTTVTATVGHDADGGFAPGQDWYVIYTPSIREVVWVDGIVGGEAESISNQVAINIDSVYGYGSVIDNYVVEEIFGTLKVTPRYITLTTGSGEWIYDDTDHSNTVDTTVSATAGYVDNGGLITGQTWNIAYAPTIREVLWVDGAVSGIENAQIIEIISANGYGDVINNYVIEEIFGTLTITPRRVIVVTGSGVWEYDGAEHYNYDDTEYTEWVEGEEYGLLPGHALTIDSYATIVDIGSTENWHNISITADAGARNVKANYDVIYELGILTILDNEKPEDDGSIVGPGIPSGGGNLKEDGGLDGEFEGSTDGEGEEPAPLFSFVVGQDGMVYFRFKSFGDYEYNGWAEAEVYTSADLTVNPLQFVGLALQNAGYGMTTIAVTDIQGGTYWMLPYYAMDDNNNLNDVVIDKGTWDSYTMNMYLYDYFTGGTLSLAGTEYEEMEQAYRDFVYSQYVSLPKDTKAEMLKIIDKQGFSAASPTIIKDVANFISDYLPYDIKTKDYEGDRAVYFFTKAETALCRYYATAATAVYRALGIPARYVSGFAAKGAAGKEVEVTAMDAHAWVEVYIDGLGWIPVEVTGRTSGDGSGGGINPGPGGPSGPGVPNDPHEELPIILRPLDVWDKYSYATTTLYATNQLDTTYIDQGYECLQAYLDQGYTYYVEVSGEQFGIGSSASTIVTFTLYNPDGVDVTDEFEFKFEEGTITLYGDFAVELISELRITYDGNTHSYHDFELIYQQMGEEFVWYKADVPDGYEITFNTEAIALRDVDTLDVEKLREHMVITLNGVLVTDSNIYEGVYIVGKTMRIQRKVIEITTGSYTAEYQEGIKVTNGSVWITKGSLAEGHKLVAVTNGLQTEVGYSENRLSVCKIVDADGNDVTDNYDIVEIYGKLEITDSK
ncbi:MAG: transglutaminase domain-containing protein [Clostridiales bacterium]|nr:transglutaminase domain-containing protein [Clostridiales bacterium]